MSDVSVKMIAEFDSPNGGGFCRARASLGVTAFGMQVENFPPHLGCRYEAVTRGKWSPAGVLDDPRSGPFVAAAVRRACHASHVAAEAHALR